MSPLFQSRFVAIGAIGDSVDGDGVQQLMLQAQAICGVMGGAKLDQRLKRFQGLHGALDANRAWQEVIFCRGLSDDRADEIVGHDMRPDLLVHQLGRLAA